MLNQIKKVFKNTPLINFWGQVRAWKLAIAWKYNGRPVPPPPYIKQRIVKSYGRHYNSKTFVETGTYLGEMVDATKNVFKQIYSIELNRDFYESGLKKFAEYPHIHLLNGDSAALLQDILNRIDAEVPILFWLDAHYSGGATACGSKLTPVLQELKTIFSSGLKDFIVLIDDARLFDGSDDYPTIDSVRAYVHEMRQDMDVSVSEDVIRICPKLS